MAKSLRNAVLRHFFLKRKAMKHFKFIVLLFLLGIVQCIYAKNVEGQENAASCLGSDNIELIQDSKYTRIFKVVDGKGYAIVSLLNPNSPKIIGYSKTSVWKQKNMPPPLSEWLEYIQENSICKEKLLDVHKGRSFFIERHRILPLLKSSWHQGAPYNDMSPIIADGNIKTAAGCVAVAAAQIVNYWKLDNPSSTLEDTPLYPYGTAPVTFSIPKGTPNNWDDILDTYIGVDDEDARNAVAQLVYVVGTTSYLNYASSTGGQISDAANAIYSQFRLVSEYSSKNKFEQENWEDLIFENLQKGFPILYSGVTKSGAGHAFVIDGYDDDLDLFHVNFGWGGIGDGFYSLDDTVGLDGYCVNQACVYGIRPEKRNITLKCDIENVTDGEACIFKLGITNHGTLPLGKIVLVDGSSSTQKELATFDVNVPNDNVERQIQVSLVSNSIKGMKSVLLKDDSGTNLGEFNIEATGINNVQGQLQNTHSTVYDLTGKPVRKTYRGRIYLYHKGAGYQKVVLN